jgi:hypothetical protein
VHIFVRAAYDQDRQSEFSGLEITLLFDGFGRTIGSVPLLRDTDCLIKSAQVDLKLMPRITRGPFRAFQSLTLDIILVLRMGRDFDIYASHLTVFAFNFPSSGATKTF